MSHIVLIQARQILDLRGNPTVEVDVLTETASLAAPLFLRGASTGVFEGC